MENLVVIDINTGKVIGELIRENEQVQIISDVPDLEKLAGKSVEKWISEESEGVLSDIIALVKPGEKGYYNALQGCLLDKGFILRKK